jgi:hypothetical protein
MKSLKYIFTATIFACSLQGQTIPSDYFGMHVGNYPSTLPGFPLAVSYGNYRFWDTTAAWRTSHICNSTNAVCLADPVTNTGLASTVIDGILANLFSAGITDNVMYTNAKVPLWAQGTALHSYNCFGGASACILPDQMNQDGSCAGVNSHCTIIDSWFHLIASHVNDATFLMTHAHIKYWEPWNEFTSDPTIGGGAGEVNATWAQLLRITENMRCIIKGVGVIHNYPTAGQSDTCSNYLLSYGWTAADPNAIITTPSIPKSRGHIGPLLNFLYCNNNPYKDLGTSTTCTWSGGLNWGSLAVDAINVHCYWTNITPETVGADVAFIKSKLTSMDLAKPFLDSESSGGAENQRDHIWNDDVSFGGGIVRQLAVFWSYGISLMWEYIYGAAAPSTTYDALYTATNGITQLGVAWNTGYAWLNGATPTNRPFCAAVGTVWTCQMTLANGSPAQLTWDSQYGPGGTSGLGNCSLAPVPLICGYTVYTVPTQYQSGWRDLNNVQHPYSSTVTIGAIPILIE